MKILATIEARMGSTRLPGKILKPICGASVLKHIYDRASKAQLLDQTIVATTTNTLDDQTAAFCQDYNIPFYRGSENDITARLVDAAKAFEATHIVQLTGDCPFVDPDIIDLCIETYKSHDFDYVSNRLRPSFPCGLEVQIFSVETLQRVSKETQDPEDREHGSYYIYNNPDKFRLGDFQTQIWNFPKKRWVLDYPEDFEFTRAVYENLFPKNNLFKTQEIIDFLQDNPEVEKLNQMHEVLVKNYI